MQIKIEWSNAAERTTASLAGARCFKKIFSRRNRKKIKQAFSKKATHVFKTDLPFFQKDKWLCLTGSASSLGNFDPANPAFFKMKKNGRAVLKIDLSKEQFPVEYKLAVCDKRKKIIIEYEPGENRILESGNPEEKISLFVSADLLQKYLWRGAGANIPLFSIRTEKSWGIGDLSDMRLLIDWLFRCGCRLIQLLPINDTAATYSDKDSYPYSAISAFALDPKYLNVESIAAANSVVIDETEIQVIKALNELPVVDHLSVLKLKIKILRRAFETVKNNFFNTSKWLRFFEKNQDWLEPYAAFCVLRDKYETADHSKWEDQEAYDEEKIKALGCSGNEHYDNIQFWYFLQYHLHRQLKAAVKYAHKKKIILKADLPIGVGRHSADTWQYPQLFDMNMQAGAPPDAFSQSGQNWGFPTYNMAMMKADNYVWFRRRMKHLEKYFDAVRIDHALGFFRIWSIPINEKDGRMGRFVPAIPVTKDEIVNAGILFDEDKFCKAASDDPTDVILLKENNGYHFRINVQQTNSFAALPGNEQEILQKLYNKYFYEDQNILWEKEGRERLQMLKGSTGMLLCAEDLGMVPAFIETVLHELNILSLRVQQMPKEENKKFSDTSAASYDSVVMPDTHDMPTMRLWWELSRKDAQVFYNDILQEPGAEPYFCEPWICEKVIRLHLQSPAMWSIFLLQDLLAMNGNIRRADPAEERINDPANNQQVWNYRMHLTLEKLLKDVLFGARIKEMVKDSGR